MNKSWLAVLLLLPQVAPAQEPTELPREERLQRFDPNTVQVRRRDGRWLVEAGDVVLKDCGRREEDARLAWHLIVQLRLNQRGVIGGLQTIMEYWLSEGQPPRGLPRNLRTLPLHPEQLTLEKAQGCWMLREPTRVLFNFGQDELEAKQALAVIRKYGFDRVGVVGQALPVMLVLAAGDDVPNPVRQVKHEPKKPAAPETATPSFYPTPILPPLSAGGKAPLLLERGRPSRLARAEEQTAPVGERHPFDPRQVQVRRENADWVLASGGLVLARFGQNERYARQAHACLLHYRLTEMITIGSPEPAVRYFLASGQAPRGMMVGAMGERFATERLMVRPFGDRHFLALGSHPVLDCGTRAEDAQEMLRVVRRFGFDHVLRIGQTDREALIVLVKSY